MRQCGERFLEKSSEFWFGGKWLDNGFGGLGGAFLGRRIGGFVFDSTSVIKA